MNKCEHASPTRIQKRERKETELLRHNDESNGKIQNAVAKFLNTDGEKWNERLHTD